jgi:hypothetical protein
MLDCEEAAPLGESGGAVGLEILSAVAGALPVEVVKTEAWTEANLCSVCILLKRNIARSRLRNGW